MKIVEFQLSSAILHEVLQRVPEMQVEWEQSDIRETENRIRVLLWAHGGDFETFEAALEDDSKVTPLRTVSVGNRRLYQIEFLDKGVETSIYPFLVEEGGVIQNLTGTHEGWEFRVGFPDQQSVSRFFELCRKQERTFDIHRFFDEQRYDGQSDFALTDPQRETLITAVDIGYLDVPRRNNLRHLGERLGISDTAASQRFRRGVKTLIEQTIYRDGRGPF